jgi:NAD kinase
MKNRFHVVDVTEEPNPNLTFNRQQQDMRNRGFVFAVIDGSDGTVVSVHRTQARAEAIADLHNERASNQRWLG